MSPILDVLETIAILVGYLFTPMLFVISIALFIHLVLKYRRRVIDLDEENSVIEPSRRYSLEPRRASAFVHGNSQAEDAILTEPRIVPNPYQCLDNQTESLSRT